MLFNQRMKAERAWRAPYELSSRIGGMGPDKILVLPLPVFTERFASPFAIHPFKFAMAENTYRAAEIVSADYDGDARNIWTDVTASQFTARLQRFPGIGAGKARVALFVATVALGIRVRADSGFYSIKSCGSLAALYHPVHQPLLVN
ncbi:hypothetical protein [Sphaerisporangium rubeum]|uniref:HhH-GPD domain-containing protein n=1 Tax=Sphaerisporangium rubeum TaxID=321317 RepID=A0A7X0M5Q0_9ACTN|nr:hypothetical protein [Sphaerisporangium rubeum]MBB6471184.1 hypothetical protein [Sphaerisporangium rubeum]